MKYTKTVDLWKPEIHQALIQGNLKLQCGQWVACGEGRKSRFVCLTPANTIIAAHWQGSSKATAKRFDDLLKFVAH